MGASSSPCVTGRAPSFTLPPRNVVLGLGIHGEAGMTNQLVSPADEIIGKVVDTMVDTEATRNYFPAKAGTKVAMMVNNLGGTSNLEMGTRPSCTPHCTVSHFTAIVVAVKAWLWLCRTCVCVVRVFVLHIALSLHMRRVDCAPGVVCELHCHYCRTGIGCASSAVSEPLKYAHARGRSKSDMCNCAIVQCAMWWEPTIPMFAAGIIMRAALQACKVCPLLAVLKHIITPSPAPCVFHCRPL